MKRYPLWCRLLVICGITCFSLSGATIVSVQDPFPSDYLGLGPTPVGDQLVTASWTTANAYTNVTVTASLFNYLITEATAIAVLTTAIGPGVTSAAEVAQTTVTLHTGGYEVQLFQLPVLPAGTYHLSLFTLTNYSDIGWLASPRASVVTAPGAAEAGYWYANQGWNPATAIDLGYLPASRFAPFDSPSVSVLYSVEGSAAVTGSDSPVPEPSVAALTAIGAVALILVRRRRLARIKPW